MGGDISKSFTITESGFPNEPEYSIAVVIWMAAMAFFFLGISFILKEHPILKAISITISMIILVSTLAITMLFTVGESPTDILTSNYEVMMWVLQLGLSIGIVYFIIKALMGLTDAHKKNLIEKKRKAEED
ncbi:unnamed protein product [marine sediment metagenome]|uniref:Uncharacterized protein n=1 Tax=marine sediment metagenome TaxID=412755 RepID=X0VRL0_9ZZZZ